MALTTHPVSQPRAVARHLRRCMTRLVILAESRANGVRPGTLLTINQRFGSTVKDVRRYPSIEQVFATERSSHYLHGAKPEQAIEYWKSRATEFERDRGVVVYELY